MRSLYLVSHQSGYRAFEDYYLSLIPLFSKQFIVSVIIYTNELEIPTQTGDDVYLFLNVIPPQFMRKMSQFVNVYLVNTEQVTRSLWRTLISHLNKRQIRICDYDLTQVKILQHRQSNVRYLPYQIIPSETEAITTLISQTPKKYDVAFCSVNQSKRRQMIYDQLVFRGLMVIDVMGWREHRDKEIAKAKVMVNVHYDTDYQIFEHLRCDRWIVSGLLVVTEESRSDPDNDLKDLVIIVPLDQMVNKIVDIVNNYDYYYSTYLLKLIEQRKKITWERERAGRLFVNELEGGAM